jgi:hypothetical protein
MNPPRPDIEIVSPTGQLSVREVFGATAYFRRPHLTIRDEVAACIQRFHALAPAGAIEYHYDYDGEQDDISDAILATVLHERFYSDERFANANLLMEGTGLHAPGYFLEYRGSALDNPALPDEAGTLQLWVPRAFFLAQRTKVLDFFTEVFATLPLSCGQIGLGLSGENKQRKQALAARYPGLDIAHPRSVSTDIGDSVGGIAWQTLLGPPLTHALGGCDTIRAAVTSDTIVVGLPGGGCRIVIGTDPQIGDVARHDVLPSYRTLAALLDSASLLHIPQRVVYFQDHAGMADLDAMHEWHGRWI